ncbi:lysosomal acid phosphatase-like isoform X1 [Oscarella lobularis]|uniref:lysosomal acid phosphatase-like isoform X1 n=2 Tax=Oscarella lobularis TaxID=121494 RepID=UPI00331398BF
MPPMRAPVVLCFIVAVSARQLQLASLVFRHGDRSPDRTFPTDPHQVDEWPQGWGQLTQMGMLQHYDLAQELLIKRYMTKGTETFLLSSSYERDEIYVRSTDVDRTLMSAECQMAALYKPTGRQVFLENLDWQPVPIHTVPLAEDKLLRGFSIDCPRYKELKEEYKNDADYLEVMAQNKDLFARVKKNAGIDYDLNPSNSYQISDPLFCEKQHNLTWADWVTEEDFAALFKVNDFSIYKLFAGKEIHRITAGPFLGEVLNHMEAKQNGGKLEATKMFVYSAHDLNVAAFLNALGLYGPDTPQPPYASIMMIELYLQDDGSTSVEVYYHMGPEADGPTEFMALPECPSPCTLEKFKAFVTPLIPDDFDKECQLSSKATKSKVGIIAGLSVSAAAVVVALVVLVVWCHRRGQRKHRFPDTDKC